MATRKLKIKSAEDTDAVTKNTLVNGDCLKVMPRIAAGSIDLILTDPPYGTTACKWDSIIPLEPMWDNLKRLIKPNGAIVMTASQPFTSILVSSNIDMFRYCWVWEKEQGSGFLSAKKLPLKSHEDIAVFYWDEAEVKGRSTLFVKLREYFISEKIKAGLCSSELEELLGNGMAGHYFTGGVQWTFPTEDNYARLQTTGYFSTDYSTLLMQYREISKLCGLKYRPIMEKGKSYTCKQGSGSDIYGNNDNAVVTENIGERYPKTVIKIKRDKNKVHPTQKPVALMEYLIKTYTNEGDVILDFTMGSGTTGIACQNLNRNFIGIELDKEYFNIACNRIHDDPELNAAMLAQDAQDITTDDFNDLII